MTQVVRRIHCAAVALLVMVCAVPASAQTATPPDTPARTVEFLPRTVFHMSAEHLSGDDPRYVWDADFGGELDVVDYGTGRFTFEANYQVVLGEEIRAFDPNQGNYILAGYASVRLPLGSRWPRSCITSRGTSRIDPSRRRSTGTCSVDACGRPFSYNKATFDARADLRGVFMKTTVDYSWELDAGRAQRREGASPDRVASRTSIFAISAWTAASIEAIKRATGSKVAFVSRGEQARSSCSLRASAGSTRIRSRLAPRSG